MPGIVAIITKLPGEVALERLQRMVSSLCHESFYTSGTFAEPSMGVYVGWTARTGSFSDGMPLRNESGGAVLAFAGEEFPDPTLAQSLKSNGHEFDSSGAAYLVHQAEEDPNFPANLNGRFHGILLDRNTQRSTVFNDRFGMHRLYFHESKDAWYFAAEAKAILAVCPELCELDVTSLGEFLACSAVLENRSIFRGISVLPPGSAWQFANGSLAEKKSYFHPREWEEQEKLDPESYYAELHGVFTRNLPRYFRSNQSIAMSLTGGLDTRMILAAIHPQPDSLPCYTFGSMFRENHDVRVARQVAEACGQQHQIITAGNEFLSKFAHYAERAVYLSDATIDVSRSPDLYLNELARQIAPVRMTGNYGGEILRGVRGFKPESPLQGLYEEHVGREIERAAKTYDQVVSKNKVSFAAFQQAPWYHQGVLSLERSQLSMRSPFLDNEFVKTVFRSPDSELSSNEMSLRLIADGSPRLHDIPTDRGIGGRRANAWAKLSRAALELSFKAEYAYDMGMPQWLARTDNLLRPLHLQRMFLGRHKPFHFRVWYRDSLGQYLRDTLLSSRALSRGFVQRRSLQTVVEAHVEGKRNYTNEIHKLLTLELIHRLFLDGPVRGGGSFRSENQLTIA